MRTRALESLIVLCLFPTFFSVRHCIPQEEVLAAMTQGDRDARVLLGRQDDTACTYPQVEEKKEKKEESGA